MSFSDILTQEKYKSSNGYEIDASEVEAFGTYKHVVDGFYSWQCGNCQKVSGSRACGWSIAGQVLVCPSCKKKVLILRNDVEYVNKKLEELANLKEEQ